MLKLLLGDPNTRKLKRYQPIVEEINFLEDEISQLTDDELRKETLNLKSKISSELDFKKQKELLGKYHLLKLYQNQLFRSQPRDLLQRHCWQDIFLDHLLFYFVPRKHFYLVIFVAYLIHLLALD